MITLNPTALEEADAADAHMKASGPIGPLHGVPIMLKDQMDAKGMPTTLGSVIFKDYYPERDCTVTAKLKAAGAIVLAKVTLGELGGGDTHGTLFGSTHNPYDFERTVGGSSGGSAAAVTANLSAVAIGQEGFASIRRPSAWNGIVGMRPTPGLVSRAGVWGGWPSRFGSLGPMTRTVADLAKVLDVMVGYDAEDPLTAHSVGFVPATYTASLDKDGLKGARIGILRTSMGTRSEPDSEDFAKITAVFDRAVGELAAAGATLVDPIEIPNLNELLAKRTNDGSDAPFKEWAGRGGNFPFASQAEMQAAADAANAKPGRATVANMRPFDPMAYHEYLLAREQLMTNVLNVMAEQNLDAIVHKTVEHQPTLISEGINPPYRSSTGAPHLNTFLWYAASMTVPAGFTTDNLPAGITFFGRPYTEPTIIKLAYAYEQATMHRRPPVSTPPLPGEP